MFYKVCEVFRAIKRKHQQEKSKFNNLIEATAIEDLFIHYSFFVEKIKWEYQYKDYHTYSKKIQFYPQIMSLILKQKLTLNLKLKAKYTTTEAFDIALMQILKDKIKNPKQYEKFETLFTLYYNAWAAEANYLNTFFFDRNYRVFIREDNTLEISPKDINQYHNWLKNYKKYQYMIESYTIKAFKNIAKLKKVEDIEIAHSEKTNKIKEVNEEAQLRAFSQTLILEDYSILNSIETSNGKIINPYSLLNYIDSLGAKYVIILLMKLKKNTMKQGSII